MLEEHEDVFDLVLTDLGLPGMGGRNFLDRIKTRFPHLSVAAMSGYATGSPGTRGELPSDITFIQKPFTPDGLLERIGRHLGRE
jgi:CheY-like chemotaxis protein